MIKNYSEIIFLLFLLALSAFFIYDVYVTSDSIQYGINLARYIEVGPQALRSAFNSEISFGYYIFLKPFYSIKIFPFYKIMNVLSYLFSILFLISVYFFTLNVTLNKWVALMTSSLTLFTATFWMLSHYGHPAIISMTFFVLSLIFLNKAISCSTSIRIYFFIGYALFVFLSLCFRLDIFLAFGGYFGLMIFKKQKSIKDITIIVISIIIAFLMFFYSRYLVLGYFFNMENSVFMSHITTRLVPFMLLKNIIKNSFVWIISLNPLLFICFLSGIIYFLKSKRFLIYIFLSIFPFTLFFPFCGMDVARLLVPTIIPVCLLTSMFLNAIFKKYKVMILIFFVFSSQFAAEFSYKVIEKKYPFKTIYKNRAIPGFPIGSIFIDHYYRSNYLKEHIRLTEKIASEKKLNILIIDNNMFYYCHSILNTGRIIEDNFVNYNETVIQKIVTKSNIFYLFDLNHNFNVKNPLKKILYFEKNKIDKVHIGEFSSEFQIIPKDLYLNDQEIDYLLSLEDNIVQQRTTIIK